MGTPGLLKLNDVHKKYYPPSGAVNVLKGVNFCLEKGKTAAITGPSGSGKTTLLNLIAALDSPDQGQIVFNGTNVTDFTDKQMVEFRMKHIGIVFQQHFLLPQCTAIENILLPTLPLKTPSDKAINRAEELLGEIGLYDRKDFFPAQLSGGECQRIAVARALINDPSLILADEPTGSLDHKNALGIIDLLKKLSDRDRSLIIVTHAEFIAEQMQCHYKLFDGHLNSGE